MAKKVAPEKVSRLDREFLENGSKKLTKLFTAIFFLFLLGVGNVWGTPTVLFHETFGDNSSSARVWDDSYKVQSGVSTVYSGASYTITNAKQSKNNVGCTQSGLLQTTKGTDASFVVGPLDVSSYESLSISFMYKAGSTQETYDRSAQYKTSSGGSWQDLTVSGTQNASTCYEQTATLPAAASGISTLYIKVVFNTSNTGATIDEFELTGTAAAPAGTNYDLTFKEWDGGGAASGSPSTGSVSANATSFSFGATEPSKTGHTIEGFYTNTSASSGVKVANSSRNFVASVTDWTNGSSQYTKGADANLYIKWSPKVCAITLDKGTSGTADGSVSYTYGNSTMTGEISHATKTGYHLDGYYTAASSGTKILNDDGTLAGNNISVSTTTYTSGGNWAYDGTSLTLYAQWTIDTYDVHWKVNGNDWEGVSHGSPSTDANYNTKPATIPTAPVSGDCDGSKVFVGWTNSTYSHASDAPTILFSSQASAPAITENTTFHAVFATAGAGGSGNIQLSYTSLSLTNSYGSGSTKSVSDVDFYCYNIITGNSGSEGYQKIQFRKTSDGAGYIYNSEILPGNITSIVFGSTNRVMTVNFGNSSNPDGSTETTTCSSSSLTATPTGNYKYFKILNSADNAAYTGTITINYSSVSYSDYQTGCCTALGQPATLTLEKTAHTIKATWGKTEGEHETGYLVQLYDNNGTGVKGSAIGDPVEINGVDDGDRKYTFGAKTPVGSRLTANHEYFVGITPTYDGDGDYCETGTEVSASTTTNVVYSVTYAAGTGGSGTMTDSNSPYEAGDEVTVLENLFTKCGSHFTGWTYSPAQSVTDGKFTIGSANVTITATWAANDKDEYYDWMSSVETATDESGSYSTPDAISDKVEAAGCEGQHKHFMGWVEESDINEDGSLKAGATIYPGNQSGMCAEGKKYYAVWADEE